MPVQHTWRRLSRYEALKRQRCFFSTCERPATHVETTAVEKSAKSTGPGFLNTRHFCTFHAEQMQRTQEAR